MTPAGHGARTPYKCDIKILKLQIDSLLDTTAYKITAKDLAEKKGDFVLIPVKR
jgi:hypothetical protein